MLPNPERPGPHNAYRPNSKEIASWHLDEARKSLIHSLKEIINRAKAKPENLLAIGTAGIPSAANVAENLQPPAIVAPAITEPYETRLARLGLAVDVDLQDSQENTQENPDKDSLVYTDRLPGDDSADDSSINLDSSEVAQEPTESPAISPIEEPTAVFPKISIPTPTQTGRPPVVRTYPPPPAPAPQITYPQMPQLPQMPQMPPGSIPPLQTIPTVEPTATKLSTPTPRRTAEPNPTITPVPETRPYYARIIDVAGIKIGANDSVPLATLDHAAAVMRPMLANPEVQRALVADGAFLGIIPRNGKLTDLPQFTHLKDKYLNPDEPDPAKRILLDDIRLYGEGSKMAVAEEYIFTYEGGERHEVGQAIYATYVYTNPERKGAWDTIYNNAKNRGIYKGTYGIRNAVDLFADYSRSLVGGVDKDEYGGPAGIKANDPDAYNFLVPIVLPPPVK